MLQGVFNYDNPVWRFTRELGDLIILNILWIVCSVPVPAAGAPTIAAYYVTLKLVRDEDDSTIRSFFWFLKSSFRQAIAIWLILLAAGIALGFDFWLFMSGQMPLNGTVKAATTTISGGLFLIYLFIIIYMFPLQARLYNLVRRALFNVSFMSMCHLFQTIGMLATDLGIATATYFGLFHFPRFAMLLFLFGMPLTVFVNSHFLTAILKKYIPREGEQEYTDAILLLGGEDEEMKGTIWNLKGK